MGHGTVVTENDVTHNGKTQPLCFGQQHQPTKVSNANAYTDNDIASPCWWVTATQNQDDANMKLESVIGKYGQNVYFITNTRYVPQAEMLRYKIADVAKEVALASAKEVVMPLPATKRRITR